MSIDAMKQALDALEYIYTETTEEEDKLIHAAITALRLAIEQAEKQEPVAWMTIDAYGEEDDIHYEDPKGGLPEGWTCMPLYTHPPKAKQPQDEPLGYWNAVQGWVELPEEAHKPTAWVYPEALEAFQKGQPWTAYGTDGKSSQNSDRVERIPLYAAPPQQEKQEPVAWANINKHGDITHTSNKQMPWANTPLYTAPPQRQPLTDEQVKVLNFLLGADDLDGVWFGERHPTERGAFWWRDRLRRVFVDRKHGIGE